MDLETPGQITRIGGFTVVYRSFLINHKTIKKITSLKYYLYKISNQYRNIYYETLVTFFLLEKF